jgi:hypothetical protein
MSEAYAAFEDASADLMEATDVLVTNYKKTGLSDLDIIKEIIELSPDFPARWLLGVIARLQLDI